MSLVGTPITRKKQLHDVLIWMPDNEGNYCCTAIEISNSSGDAVEIEIGTVVQSASLADNADPIGLQPAIIDALVLERKTIPDGESRNFRALVRGPALVNFDEVVRADGESDGTLTTRLADLVTKGVRFKREPTNKEVPDLNG